MFAQVVVNRPTHRRPAQGSDPVRGEDRSPSSYTYRLPESMRDQASVGHLVRVPLGTGAALGVIVDLSDEYPADLKPVRIRDIDGILDPLPVVTPVQIDLARWIAEQICEPLNRTLRLMLPPALEARTFVVVNETVRSEPSGLTRDEQAALRVLRNNRGRVRLSVLLNKLRSEDPEAVVDALTDRGLVSSQFAFVPPKPAPPRVQYVQLLADDRTISANLPRLGRPSKQAEILLALARRVDAPVSLGELCALVDCTASPVRAVQDREWIKVTEPRKMVAALPTGMSGAMASLSRAPKQAAALSALLHHGGAIEIDELLARAEVSPSTVAQLERKGLVRRFSEPPLVLLILPVDKVIDVVTELRGAEKERAVLSALQGCAGRVWVGGVYAETGADLTTLQKLAGRGLVTLHADEYDRPTSVEAEEPLPLTPDQAAVWQVIRKGMTRRFESDAPFVALLHGVTGSGKTEVYLRALETVLEQGMRAMILVPEISLTAQTVRRFESRFPGRVVVLHSQLSHGQRYAVWDRVRRGEADVLVGPRSALFAPMPRVGLVVLDEAHDDSYKQDDPITLPAYDARACAAALAEINGCSVLFGTATPDVVTYHRASHGSPVLLSLKQRIHALPASRVDVPGAPRFQVQPLPPVRIVDLRQELRAGNRSIFSRTLQAALSGTLEAGEQAILFLNRRGSATFVLCRDCGYVAQCPNCRVPLTYHTYLREGLVCHHCNHRVPAPAACPDCGGSRIRYFGLGTERVEDAMRQLLPNARLLRWDRDTATGYDHERYLQDFVEQRADVLIGTQMIAKGLDLPLVTLVGVISADTSLNLPDYRSAERAFQLLTQVAGRAGRSHRGGQVIVQTYHPEHYAIQAASRHDYASFYRQEIAHRRQLGYPPFSRLVALRYADKDAARAQSTAERMGRWLSGEIKRKSLPATLIGPAPCFFARVDGRYRWQIVIRSADPLALVRDVELPWGWRVDVDPVSLL